MFKDARGKALYVGKATTLRKRGVTYLSGGHDPRIAAMLGEAADLTLRVLGCERILGSGSQGTHYYRRGRREPDLEVAGALVYVEVTVLQPFGGPAAQVFWYCPKRRRRWSR